MAVTNDFTGSELDLNGKVSISGPTALVWGPDGRLYVTQVTGEVFVLTVEFGDKNPSDGDATKNFYVSSAETVTGAKESPNHNDDGTAINSGVRQVTGIDVTAQLDASGNPVVINGKPAVVMYVTSSDSRQGAGGGGEDKGLDTNSGVITRLTQMPDGSWDAVDIVRGLPRSEENHATNGLEVIQEIVNGVLSERLLVASGGNANTGAPSNNFAGQQETPYSGAILEVDLDEINALPVLLDGGRQYVYDMPTLDDPTRAGIEDAGDPFGGNDGLNSAKLIAGGPVQIYSAGYRNPYDVEVTEDGRVYTYDNGANNVWGGRPAGEDQNFDNNATEPEAGTPTGYIATNLFVEDNAEQFPTGVVNFNPQNWDQLHEVTRSDDLNGRSLAAGQGGAQVYTWDHPDFAQPLQLVYGGHPNPTRAEGARAGLLYSPEAGTGGAKLMVSNVASPGNSATSDYLEVVAWFSQIGYSDAFINSTVVALEPGMLYADTFASGFGGAGAGGRPTTPGVFSLVESPTGPIGLPLDIDDIVAQTNVIEGNYLEAGYTDGAIDTGKGSVNGLTEYTSNIFGTEMQGALIAASLNQAQYFIIGRNASGIVETTLAPDGSSNVPDRTIAADRGTLQSDGAPLGLASLGDDLSALGDNVAFRGTIWGAIYKENGPVIEIFQPGNPDTNLLLGEGNYAGQAPADPTDNDLDGVDYINDPFDFDSDNGVTLGVGQSIVLDFSQVDLSLRPDFSGTIGDTGLMGAALDGVTPNRDAITAADGATSGFEAGLFDNGGNIIPGGNAPILQIKNVQDGTAIGSANTLKDGLHTGVKLGNGVTTMTATVDIFNWYASQPGEGRISGLTFSDGTQSNFIRFVFGDINDALGLEVGIEIGDTYTVLGTSTDAAFVNAIANGTSAQLVTLQLEISDIGGNYDLAANFKVTGDTEFTSVSLNNANVPAGVLRDVLDGTHTISDGDTTLTSGAAIGIVAEKDNGATFEAVDFNEIRISGSAPNESILYRVNAGETVAATDGGLDWLSDAALFDSTGPVSITGTAGKLGGITPITDSENEVDYAPNVNGDEIPWQLFTQERFDNTNDNLDITYNFDVDAGKTYKVSVFYTENFNNIFTADPRIFDISVEGIVPAVFNDIHPLREAVDLVDGINAPIPTDLANNTAKQPYIGLAFQRDYVYDAEDDKLNLALLYTGPGTQAPKINAIQISEIVRDTAGPIVLSIDVEDSVIDVDSPRDVTVIITDETGFSSASFTGLDGSELNFTGITPASVGSPSVSLSSDQRTATLVYEILPPAASNAWPAGTFQISVAAGAYIDVNNNPSVPFSSPFVFLEPDDGTGSTGFGTALNEAISALTGLPITQLQQIDGNDLVKVSEALADFAANAYKQIETFYNELKGIAGNTGYVPGLTLANLDFGAGQNGPELAAGTLGAASANQTIQMAPAQFAPEQLVQTTEITGETLAVSATSVRDILLRINAFGDAIAATDGPDWDADTTANPSPFYSSTQNRGDLDRSPATPGLDNVPDAIFATGRSDNGTFSYDIPLSALPGVEAGDTVTVNLYFAEAANGTRWQSPTARIFDVVMEGTLAIDDLSPVGAFGYGGGGVISTVVKVTGDALNIAFLNNNVQNALVNGIEIVLGGENPINGSDPVDPPVDPTDVFAILGLDDGDFDGTVQGFAVDAQNDGGSIGSVALTILDGSQIVDRSNFANNSFQLTNTGNKEVAAVFIDIRTAVFADQVFDVDGTGGDTTAKSFRVDTAGNTGAFFAGVDGVPGTSASNLFFAGATPLADTSGLSANGGNAPISGGHRGLLVRFDGSNGGFGAGETVGFSGDGDSNSIAGFSSSLLNPNNVTADSFDTGGQSGAELLGASFTVLFADGTTATGYLGSDTTQAGAAGEAVQGRTEKSASLSVDTGTGTFGSGDAGTYGGIKPVITVSGAAGDVVRVTLHKGFQPTDDTAGGTPDLVADVIQARLDQLNPEFAVNNAFDVQTFDVTIGSNGTAVLPANAFDYVNTLSGETFAGQAVQPLALTAAVVLPVTLATAVEGSGNNDLVPAGPVSAPIYLSNPTQTPVTDGPVAPAPAGYFALQEIADSKYFKIQIEDENGTGGANPGGKWNYETSADSAGRQSGFEGDGYYLFDTSDSRRIDNEVGGNELLEYTIYVPEDALGVYSFSFRVARDGVAANDQQNDLWLNFKHAEVVGNGNIEEFIVGNDGNEIHPSVGGFLKIFGGKNTGVWSNTDNVDGSPNNFDAMIEITEAGLYTVQIDGRSSGYHIDSFEIYQGANPSGRAADSVFIRTEVEPTTNTAPLALNDTLTTDADTVMSINLLDNDFDAEGDTLVLTSVNDGGAAGTISFTSNGAISYDPNGSFDLLPIGQSVAFELTYTVSDGELIDTGTVNVTVNGTFDNGSEPEPGQFNLILGDESDNVLNGTAGADLIRGFGGADEIYGNGGDDFIFAGAGGDRKLYGGAGSDTFVFSATGDGTNIVRDFEDGIDKIGFEGDLVFSDLSIDYRPDINRVVIQTPGSDGSAFDVRVVVSYDGVMPDLTEDSFVFFGLS